LLTPGYILLATALQHGALYGIETVEDFARFDLSSGEPITRGKLWSFSVTDTDSEPNNTVKE
jgi:hypothetical protein